MTEPYVAHLAPGFPDVGKLRPLSADTLLSWVPWMLPFQVSNISVFAIVTPNLDFLLSTDGSYHSH